MDSERRAEAVVDARPGRLVVSDRAVTRIVRAALLRAASVVDVVDPVWSHLPGLSAGLAIDRRGEDGSVVDVEAALIVAYPTDPAAVATACRDSLGHDLRTLLGFTLGTLRAHIDAYRRPAEGNRSGSEGRRSTTSAAVTDSAAPEESPRDGAEAGAEVDVEADADEAAERSGEAELPSTAARTARAGR